MFSAYSDKNEKNDKSAHTVTELPWEDIGDLLNAFNIFDVQNRGYIETRDLREAFGFSESGIPSEQLRQVLADMDLLKDRKITFSGTMEALISGHPRNAKKVTVTGADRLREWYS